MNQPTDSIRLNRWARTAHEELSDVLDGYQAEYRSCVVDDDGTRQMRWSWQNGELGASSGRRRELLVRSLNGDLDRWELVFREVGNSRVGDRVYYYASTSASERTLDQLRPSVIELVEDGLEHLDSPTDTCGHIVRHDSLITTALGTLTLALACLAALSLWLDWPGLVQALLFLAAPLCTAGLLFQALRHWFGLDRVPMW